MAQITKSIGWAGLAISLLLAAGCGEDEPPATELSDENRQQAEQLAAAADQGPEALWGGCAACHGANGEGSKELGAPSLVHQDSWYLKRQLQNFRSGLRGAGEGDAQGAQMVAMAQALPGDEAIDSLVAYIDSELPDTVPAATIEGDVAVGRDHYDMICGACHGPGGEGNEILGAPRLAGVDDWYLVAQYGKFAEDLRGDRPDDKYGQRMRMLSGYLPDEATINNVFAYIRSQADE